MGDEDRQQTFPDRVCAIIRHVPEGSVVTYGQVAALAGRPRAARQVGYILAALPESSAVPWHRVINTSGAVSQRSSGGGIREGYQRHLLEEEGVVFDHRGRVSLETYRWDPVEGASPRRRRTRR